MKVIRKTGVSSNTTVANEGIQISDIQTLEKSSLSNAISVEIKGVGKLVSNIFDHVVTTDSDEIDLVRLSENDTPLMLFTKDAVETYLHYLNANELKGYVHCNGDDCVLCKLELKRSKRFLMPVFRAIPRDVAVLSISDSLRPHALFPQLKNAMKTDQPQVLFIRKSADHLKFQVKSVMLDEDMDDGSSIISRFVEKWEKGDISLESVYPQVDNDTLLSIHEIAQMALLKAI